MHMSRTFRGSDAVMLVYDITNYHTFKATIERFQTLCNWCPDAIFMLVGNSCDQAHRRQVSEAEGKHFAVTNIQLYIYNPTYRKYIYSLWFLIVNVKFPIFIVLQH